MHLGQKDMKAQLPDLGDAQPGMAQEVGVLWAAFFLNSGREQENWQAQLSQVWQMVGRSMGVNKVSTPDHEPTME